MENYAVFGRRDDDFDKISFFFLGFHEVLGDMVNAEWNSSNEENFLLGFIDFEDQRDAADAVKALDGKWVTQIDG